MGGFHMDTAPATNDEKPNDEKTPAKPVIQAPSKTSAPSGEPRNFLAAFLLTCSFGVLGIRHFYLGDKKLGWLRTGLFVGGYLLIFLAAFTSLPALGFLGFLAIAAAWIWAIVDFFYVYNAVKTDTEGHPLAATTRDKKWAKTIYFVTIGAFVISTLFATLGISYLQANFKDLQNTNSSGTQLEGSDDFNYDNFLRELKAEQEKQQSQSY